MSYDLHEAFSLDSFQDRLLFFEDFEGDSLKDLWTSTGDAGGSVVVVDQQDGGIVRLTTDGDNGDDWQLTWGTIRSLLVSKQVTIEFRLKFNSVSNTNARLSLRFDNNNRIHFEVLGTAVNIHTRNGGASTTLGSGVTMDTDYHIYRIECFPTGEVHYYIDDVETSNSPITTNIPSDYLEPYFWLQTTETATKSFDLDYVYVRQER